MIFCLQEGKRRDVGEHVSRLDMFFWFLLLRLLCVGVGVFYAISSMLTCGVLLLFLQALYIYINI